MPNNEIAAQHRAITRYLQINQAESSSPRNGSVKITTHHHRQPSPELADVRKATLEWLERQRRQARVRGAK
jgi:hypothetical protein